MILKIIPSKWIFYEDFKDWIWALAEQICVVKTSERSKMNPKKYFYKTAFSAQLQCLASRNPGLLTSAGFISTFWCPGGI